MKTPLRPLLLLVLSCFFQLAMGQNGTLFTVGANQGRAYAISFPSGASTVIDSSATSDIARNRGKLFLAGDLQQGNRSLKVFNEKDLTFESTILNADARWVEPWDDRVVVAADQPPFLRIYDTKAGHQQVTTILQDTSIVDQTPVDLLVADSRAYLLLQDRVVVVDLDLEDTLAVVRLSPHWAFAAFPQYLAASPDDIYVYYDYATGAIRSSLMTINRRTLESDSALFADGFGSFFAPVWAKDKLLCYDFPTFYSPQQGFMPTVSIERNAPIAYDPVSDQAFLISLTSTPSIFVEGQSPSSGITLGEAVRRAWFFPESTTSIENPLESVVLRVFPNPASDDLWINLTSLSDVASVSVFDATGREWINQPISNGVDQIALSVNELPRGGYFLSAFTQDREWVSTPFVKW
ncbi:MAG: T9SS type A sorting domain-containing protein [Bacteroidota bacterium]